MFLLKFEFQPIKKTTIISACSIAVLTLSVISGIEEYVPIYTYIGIVLTILIIKGEDIFDNAFAAAQSSEKKSVEISVKLLSENLFFTITNSISHKVEITNNILKTEKLDKKRHGFGLENAVLCAEKNGGALNYKCSDTYFVAELILPSID